MANSTSMSYGDYTFSPVPLVEISKEIIRTGDESPIQEVTTVQLQGTLVASDNLQSDQGLDFIKARMNALRDAFKDDCKLFLVQCGGTDIIRARPKVISPPAFTPTGNNWYATAEFTITLAFNVEVDEDTNYDANVKSVNETWSLEFDESFNQYTENIDTGDDHIPYVLRYSHNVSAEGIGICDTGLASGTGAFEKPGWQEAKDWVLPRLGYDASCISSGASGIINVDPDVLGVFNHMRTKTLDEVNGSFEVNETWLLVNTGTSGLAAPGGLEDFTVTTTVSRSAPYTSIRVEGSIQGLENRSYGSSPGDFSVDTDKYANALTYWNTVKNRLYARAKHVADNQLSLTRELHVSPVATTVSHAKAKGVINYTYEYDDRVCFLLETGSLSGSVLSEIITVNDTNPTDVFVTIPILGRPTGPILQEISTVTEKKRDVSIEVLVEPPTGCSLTAWNAYRDTVKSEVENILCEFQTELTDAADQVFKHADNESWVAQQGRYSRQIGWTYQDCSGTGNTSVC